jgi:shikimate dehydrogenase
MRKFGLIGYPLGHSFSKQYFAEKFQRESLNDCAYVNYEISQVSQLHGVLADPELLGLNVTIPYKESVISFLNHKDRLVEETGACNCIRIDDGILTGYNTDVVGFEKSLNGKLMAGDKRALILGTGGSSKAVAWVLKKKGIAYLFVSRKKTGAADQVSYEYLNPEMIGMHSLIINTTPLGMSPNTDDCPPIPYGHITSAHYLFDLIYNPSQTLFLQKGKNAGARIKNGADMLSIQAEESWMIWNRDNLHI